MGAINPEIQDNLVSVEPVAEVREVVPQSTFTVDEVKSMLDEKLVNFFLGLVIFIALFVCSLYFGGWLSKEGIYENLFVLSRGFIVPK